MRRKVVSAWSLAVFLMLVPAMLVWYLNIAGLYRAIKGRSRKMVCSIDTDCPPGHICVDGVCVPVS